MQLPSGAQTWLSCGYDNAWTLTEHLTATLVDALNVANWQRAGGQNEPPAPVKRPADLRGATSAVERRAAKAKAFRERATRASHTTPIVEEA